MPSDQRWGKSRVSFGETLGETQRDLRNHGLFVQDRGVSVSEDVGKLLEMALKTCAFAGETEFRQSLLGGFGETIGETAQPEVEG